MTIYTVINQDLNYIEDFYNLSDAKKAMKKYNAKGYKTKIYSNGEWIPCGEISLNGNNKTFIANSQKNMKKPNY